MQGSANRFMNHSLRPFLRPSLRPKDIVTNPLKCLKMSHQRRSPSSLMGLIALMTPIWFLCQSLPAKASASCPAALDQMRTHRVAAGDTLASVAAAYQLQPTTITRFNPQVGSSANSHLSTGANLVIPPFDGLIASVSADESWQSLAERYGSRADLLFEVNGCAATVPGRIFIPGNLAAVANRPAVAQLSGYPLAVPADIAISYGWQPHTDRDELVFNSGIAFAIPTPNTAVAVDRGTVAFAGERAGYGLMVVINHAQGLQTRYANLTDLSVAVGQTVNTAAPIGSVGKDAPGYLYFEVRTNSPSGWVAEDPGKYMPALELR